MSFVVNLFEQDELTAHDSLVFQPWEEKEGQAQPMEGVYLRVHIVAEEHQLIQTAVSLLKCELISYTKKFKFVFDLKPTMSLDHIQAIVHMTAEATSGYDQVFEHCNNFANLVLRSLESAKDSQVISNEEHRARQQNVLNFLERLKAKVADFSHIIETVRNIEPLIIITLLISQSLEYFCALLLSIRVLVESHRFLLGIKTNLIALATFIRDTYHLKTEGMSWRQDNSVIDDNNWLLIVSSTFLRVVFFAGESVIQLLLLFHTVMGWISVSQALVLQSCFTVITGGYNHTVIKLQMQQSSELNHYYLTNTPLHFLLFPLGETFFRFAVTLVFFLPDPYSRIGLAFCLLLLFFLVVYFLVINTNQDVKLSGLTSSLGPVWDIICLTILLTISVVLDIPMEANLDIGKTFFLSFFATFQIGYASFHWYVKKTEQENILQHSQIFTQNVVDIQKYINKVQTDIASAADQNRLDLVSDGHWLANTTWNRHVLVKLNQISTALLCASFVLPVLCLLAGFTFTSAFVIFFVLLHLYTLLLQAAVDVSEMVNISLVMVMKSLQPLLETST